MSKELKRFIISDLDDMKGVNHCTGCFGCFFISPGQCVLEDPCKDQGKALGHCQEIVIISELTFGGYSPYCKLKLDRSLPYIHGDFHIFHGQMHHKGRYENDPTLKVYFYGPGTAEEKKTAETLVERNSYNLALNHYQVNFADTKEEALAMAGLPTLYGQAKETTDSFSLALINGSPRAMKGASGCVMKEFKERLEERTAAEMPNTKVEIAEYFFNGDSLGESLSRYQQEQLLKADHMIFIFPLYLDSPPSNMQACLKDMENLKKAINAQGKETKKSKISVIALAGLYEGVQTETGLNIMKYWANHMDYQMVQGCGFGGCGALPGLKKVKPGEGVKKGLMNLYDLVIDGLKSGKGVTYVYESINMERDAYQESCESVFRGLAEKNGWSLEDMGRRL